MRPQLTEEQLKSLKLFSYYLLSHGADTAYKNYMIEYCEIVFEDDFQSDYTSLTLETYDKIDEVIKEIVESNELVENATTDCDLRGELILEIDNINRILTATATQWEYSTEGSSESKTLQEISEEFDEEMYNEVLRIFEVIGDDGEGSVSFSGGGDSGELDDNMYINGNLQALPKLIENMLYGWLEETGIDWYNNEGGQGNFFFNPSNSEIILEIETNYEEAVNVPLNFEIKF